MSPKTSLGVKDLFKPSAPPTKESKQVKPLAPYKRQTYHLRSDQIKKIKEYAFFNEIDRSAVVRQALDKFIGKWKSPIIR